MCTAISGSRQRGADPISGGCRRRLADRGIVRRRRRKPVGDTKCLVQTPVPRMQEVREPRCKVAPPAPRYRLTPRATVPTDHDVLQSIPRLMPAAPGERVSPHPGYRCEVLDREPQFWVATSRVKVHGLSSCRLKSACRTTSSRHVNVLYHGIVTVAQALDVRPGARMDF